MMMKRKVVDFGMAAFAALTIVTVEAGTWRAYEGNPVLGNEKLGTCFDVNVVTDGPAPYTMYFSWRPKKAIALVRSDDALKWTQEPEICLAADPTSGWETDLNRSCTVKKDGVWHMWYTGQAKDAKRGWMSRIGYATSKDGVHFTRVRKEPVMVPEFDFEKESVMNPYVRWDAVRGVWRMWYAAGETYEPNVLCAAESKDGLNWTKWGGNPMFGGAGGIAWDRDRVGACEVYPLPDGRWAMFYIGYSDIDTARIGCAISKDGLTDWKRLDSNPLVAPDLGTWNGSACYKPSCIRDEKRNRWMLWYNGRNGGPEYVGCVIHDGLDLEASNAALPDTKELLKTYVRRFNRKDVELYTNAVSNAQAEEFMLANCPRFACPDKDIERTYYFRWWTFRKHLRKGGKAEGWRITEFLPKVPWSGKDNTIVCPAGHHLREGRWLRDPKYVTDDARFWLADPEATHRWGYSSWLFTGACGVAEVTGDDKLPVELLDAAVAYYRRWEQGFERGGWPHEKTARMGGDGKGGFLSIDNHEGTEISLGGNGYKPLFASAMWSEANAIARVAKSAGRDGLAAEFAAKAETARQSLLEHCWNPEVGFFTTEATNGVKGVVRELHGYAPWYFGVPTDGRKPDWAQLVDPQGFSARYGLTFPERRAKGFAIDYAGHECKWNGPSWPFATSIALTALANDLHGKKSKSGVEVEERMFASLLWQYADAQRRTHPRAWEEPGGDWEVVPWIDENLNPDKAEWLSREIIRKTPEMAKRFPKERGKDYNHSTFCDLVISGLVGFVPNGAKGFTVDPLFPATWDYLVLENLRYRGHDVAIRWQRGKGLTVEVDGQMKAQSPVLKRQEVAFGTELAPCDLRARDLAPLAECREAKGEPVVWIEGGKALLPIVADTKDKQAGPAAKFLQDLVFKMTGVKPKIVVRADGAAVRIATPAPQSGAFTVKTEDGSVVLGGHGAYATYDFAERVLGFRRYFNPQRGGDSVVKTKGLVIPPLDYADRPVYAYRFLHPLGIPWMKEWKIGNDCQAGMTVHAPHRWHSDTNFNYRATRPEIFERREDGQRAATPMLCYGNPKTLETYLERIEEQLAGGRSSGGIFGGKNVIVSQWDGGLCCTCDDCLRLRDRTAADSGTYSPVIWGTFTRQLSDALKKTHPDFRISILPYHNTCDLPKGLTFPNGNVQAWLVTMPGLAMLKDERVKRHEEDLIRTWAKATGNKVVNWHYFCYPAQFTSAPFLYCNAMVGHWRDIRDFVEGAYMDSYNEPARRGELNAYVWFRALWNPDLDVEAIADEFARRMFGAAAKEMREVIRMQEAGWNRRWEHPRISQKNIFTVSYPREEVKRMEALIAAAKARVEGDGESAARLDWYAAQFDQFFKDSAEYAMGSKYTPFFMDKVAGTPKVDGILDDPCWQKIEPRVLVEGLDRTRKEPPVRTTARVAWLAGEGICFAVRCEEPQMDRACRTAPPCTNNETVEIFFDPSGEGTGDFAQFTMDISGGWRQYFAAKGWKNVRHAVHEDATGWSAEVFVPFSDVRSFANAKIPATAAGGISWIGNITRMRFGPPAAEKRRAEFSRVFTRYHNWNKDSAAFGPMPFREW